MPRRDGTGPMGRGPLTGRQMGYCGTGRGYNTARYGRRMGLGLGFGRGLARGARRYAYYDDYDMPVNYNMTPENEKSILQNEKTILESQLKEIKERLDGLNEEK